MWSCAGPGGIQMGPRNGKWHTPFWAHPFKIHIPRGLLRRPLGWEAWLFLFLVPGMKLEHRLNALASNALKRVLADLGAFMCGWRTDLKLPLKTPEHKRFGLWNCVSFVPGAWRWERAGSTQLLNLNWLVSQDRASHCKHYSLFSLQFLPQQAEICFCSPHQESGRADWQVCGWLQGSGSPQAQRGRRRSSPAQLCWPLCVLQEVHGAVLPAQHWGAHDCPDHHLPEVPAGIRLENSLWKPAQVSLASPVLQAFHCTEEQMICKDN